MIKRIDEITISDFDRIESTGKVNHLVKGFIPVYFYRKKIAKLIEEIGNALNDNKVNDIEELDKHRISSLNKINILELHLQYLYFIIVNQLELEHILKITKGAVNTKFKGINIEQLKESLETVKALTGIDIDSNPLVKMNEVRSEIEFLKDKYIENYTKKKQNDNKDKISLAEFAGEYLLYIGGDLKGISDMKIIDLITVKKLADKKYKMEQKQLKDLK
jgi:hypothetical protein